MTVAQPDPHGERDRRHTEAVTRSLGWAEEAAEQADWANALGWIAVVDACGDELPAELKAKCDTWRRALSELRARSRRVDPPDERATA